MLLKTTACFLIALTSLVTATVFAQEKPLAFPGAEGYGKYTTGGRGGSVRVVTNLKDSGEGSLREALATPDSRIIVFAVSGTIHLESRLGIPANTTITAQSAPGEGICLADYSVGLKGDNIIVRHMRFRMGDRYQNKGRIPGGGSDDAFSTSRKKNIIIDHCSFSWSTDEALSVYNGDSTTLQWNIISEPLDYSYHFETGDKDFEQHGFGGIWGGRHFTAHHNLFAHCNSRTPRFNGIRGVDMENADFRNNVIYNWGGNNVYAGEGGSYNVVNNYYKPGPSTRTEARKYILNPYELKGRIPFGKFYLQGNYLQGSPGVTANNWKGVIMGGGAQRTLDTGQSKVDREFSFLPIPTQSAQDAYNSVLKSAGATLPARDTLDARIVRNVKEGTGKIIDVQGGYPHGTSYEESAKAWPALKSTAPLTDSDKDGMPDAWEKKHGLNPAQASDATAFTLDKNYCNIEVYLNSLMKGK